jgi:hypothetical protein
MRRRQRAKGPRRAQLPHAGAPHSTVGIRDDGVRRMNGELHAALATRVSSRRSRPTPVPLRSAPFDLGRRRLLGCARTSRAPATPDRPEAPIWPSGRRLRAVVSVCCQSCRPSFSVCTCLVKYKKMNSVVLQQTVNTHFFVCSYLLYSSCTLSHSTPGRFHIGRIWSLLGPPEHSRLLLRSPISQGSGRCTCGLCAPPSRRAG